LNPEDCYQHVLRLGKQYFGENNASLGMLPVKASEDFGLYLNKVHSGAYFFVSGGDSTHFGENHNSHFDFNDDLIKKMA
jgi:metal-dependent amidase/aminoacylase/carboxypeptidase family protein